MDFGWDFKFGLGQKEDEKSNQRITYIILGLAGAVILTGYIVYKLNK